ncbi:MAG: antiterminator LoaP [Spirochaetales bacterium]|nr:antiterminator LoaP [Spirochaetales bacterium]
MRYYVIQVQTQQEDKFLAQARVLEPGFGVNFYLPRRSLRIRKKGIWRETLATIFPGYLFLYTDQVPDFLYWEIKQIPGFLRFLKSNQNIVPLEGKDKDILSHFLSFGEVVSKSEVYFDVNRKMVVKKGPLKGLEGLIVKVDRRKKRVKLRLVMYEESFLVDFGYEDVESSS